ncbi:MAG: lysophospholipase L1-like esterase, partial [Verrucomicrobia bacterium]|nr:lysophospholipase L1-like esterase [Verrucomicrobiota bacterium]
MKISIIFLLGGLGLSAWAQAPAASGAGSRLRDMIEEGRPVKIACFGDSVTGVYYHTGTRRAWCDLLGLALRRIYPQARLEMINAGVSGNDTGDGLKRMERDVLRHSPQLAIIMFGLNDARSQSPATYRKNLGTMVRRVRDAGAEAMLMTPNAVGPDDPLRPPRIVAEYAQIMRDVGSDLAVPVVDAYATFAVIQGADPATWRRLMSDTIHPNMRGHRIFAEETAQAISGRFVSLAELPALKPGLPFVLARL